MDRLNEKLDIPTFAKKIKEKYQDYKDIDDAELVERTVRKHPVYTNQVDLPSDFRLLQTSSGYQNIDDLYEQIGREENVDPNLLLEQGRQETINFKPEVFYGKLDSPKGARGAGQFMPGTAPSYGLTVNDQVDDRTDPIKSIRAQAKYMRKLLDQFDGDENLALAGYNAGEFRKSLQKGQIPDIPETQKYVSIIGENLQKARSKGLTLKTTNPVPQPEQNPQVAGTIKITGQNPNGSYSGVTSNEAPNRREILEQGIANSQNPQRIADYKKQLGDLPSDFPQVPKGELDKFGNPATWNATPETPPDFFTKDGQTIPITPPTDQPTAEIPPNVYQKRDLSTLKNGDSFYDFEKDATKTPEGLNYLGMKDGEYYFSNQTGRSFKLDNQTKKITPIYSPEEQVKIDEAEEKYQRFLQLSGKTDTPETQKAFESALVTGNEEFLLPNSDNTELKPNEQSFTRLGYDKTGEVNSREKVLTKDKDGQYFESYESLPQTNQPTKQPRQKGGNGQPKPPIQPNQPQFGVSVGLKDFQPIVPQVDPIAPQQPTEQPKPQGQPLYEAKNNQEILTKGSAGTIPIDLSDVPNGVNKQLYAGREALRRIAPNYELTDAEIDSYLAENPNRLPKVTDRNGKEYNSVIDVTVQNQVINEILNRRNGNFGKDVQTNIEQPTSDNPFLNQLDKDKKAQNAYINPELQTDIQAKNAQYQVGNRNLQGSTDVAREREAIKQDLQQEENDRQNATIFSNPGQFGQNLVNKYQAKNISNEDVDKEIQRRKDNTEFLRQLGESLQMPSVSGGIAGGELAGRIGGGVIGGLGRLSENLGGLARPMASLGLSDQATVNLLKNLGSDARVISDASSKNAGLVGDLANMAGGAVVDIPKLALTTTLLGGNAVLAFGLDAATQSAGRGEDLANISKEGAKGLILGAVFHGASKLGGMVENSILNRALVKNGLKDASDLLKNGERLTDAEISGLQKIAQAKVRLERGAFSETDKELFDLSVKPQIEKIAYKLTPNAIADLEKELSTLPLKSQLTARLAGEGVKLGTIAGGTFATEKASGAETKDALKSALLMTIFDLAMNGKSYGELANLSGKVFRVWKDGQPHDILINDATVSDAQPKGLLKAGEPNVEVVDVTGKVKNSDIQAEIVDKRPTVQSEADGSRPTKEFTKPTGETVQFTPTGETEKLGDATFVKGVTQSGETVFAKDDLVKDIAQPQRVEIKGKGEGTIIEDRGDKVLVEFNEGKSRILVRKNQVTPIEEKTAPEPEAPETIAAQVESAVHPESPRLGVLYTDGETEPKPPKGFIRAKVKEGILHINKEKAKDFGLDTSKKIQDFVKENGVSSLIGKVEEVKDTTQGIVVVTTDADTGLELSSSVVSSEENAQNQIDIDKQSFPGKNHEHQIMTVPEAVEHRRRPRVNLLNKQDFQAIQSNPTGNTPQNNAVNVATATNNDSNLADKKNDSLTGNLNSKYDALDERAKKLGYDNVRQFNMQNVTADQEKLSDEARSLLEDSGNVWKEAVAIDDAQRASKLHPQLWENWKKVHAPTLMGDGFNNPIQATKQNLAKAELFYNALKLRSGENETVTPEMVVKALSMSREDADISFEDFQKKYDKEDDKITTEEYNDIIESRKEFNKALDQTLERINAPQNKPVNVDDAKSESNIDFTPLAESVNALDDLVKGKKQLNRAVTNIGDAKGNPIKILNEVNRVKLNLSQMGKEADAVRQALKPLEENLKSQGYEIVDLLGKEYDEGMNVVGDMETMDNLQRGEQRIKRVIKPQIMKDGEMIHPAEVVVGYHPDETPQDRENWLNRNKPKNKQLPKGDKMSTKDDKLSETKHEFSSTQVNLPAKESARVRTVGKKLIKKADLAEDGFEDSPHITVKFGLHSNNADDVKDLISAQKPFTVKLGKTSIFESNEDYDVVKVDVDSPELHAINKIIAENTRVTDTHPTYQPHVTLAYVKKGEGKKYVGDSSLEGRKLKFNSIAFSDKDGNMIDIPLTGKAIKQPSNEQVEQQQAVAEVQPEKVDTKSNEIPQQTAPLEQKEVLPTPTLENKDTQVSQIENKDTLTPKSILNPIKEKVKNEPKLKLAPKVKVEDVQAKAENEQVTQENAVTPLESVKADEQVKGENVQVSNFPNDLTVTFKPQIGNNGDFILAVTNPTVLGNNKKIAVLGTVTKELEGKKYLSIETVKVRPEYEGKGIGTDMYRHIMQNLPDGYSGIYSPAESRVNKEQIPSIHNKLAKEFNQRTLDNGDIIFESLPNKSRETETKDDIFVRVTNKHIADTEAKIAEIKASDLSPKEKQNQIRIQEGSLRFAKEQLKKHEEKTSNELTIGDQVTYKGQTFEVDKVGTSGKVVALKGDKSIVAPVGKVTKVEQTPTTQKPFEMTRMEFRDAVLTKNGLELVNMPEWLDAHKKAVEQALSEGKTVPQSVLAEYPDLAEKVKEKSLPVEAEKSPHYQVYYNGKVVTMDYAPKDKQFRVAGQRIADNLGTGGFTDQSGFIKTPKGEIFEVSRSNKSAKKLTGEALQTALEKFAPNSKKVETEKSLPETAKDNSPKSTLEVGEQFTLPNKPDIYEVLPSGKYSNKGYSRIKNLTTGEVHDKPFTARSISKLKFVDKPQKIKTRSEQVADERSAKIRDAKELGISKDEREARFTHTPYKDEILDSSRPAPFNEVMIPSGETAGSYAKQLNKGEVEPTYYREKDYQDDIKFKEQKAKVEADRKTKEVSDVDQLPQNQTVSPNVEKPTVAETKASVKDEKINPRTGLTKTQTEYLAKELQDIANAKLKELGWESNEKVSEVPSKWAETLPLEAPDFIKVPGDGQFKIENLDAANRLHHKITGKPLPNFGKTSNTSIIGTTRETPKPSKAVDVSPIELYGTPEMAHKILTEQRNLIEDTPENKKQLSAIDAMLQDLEYAKHDTLAFEGEPLTTVGKQAKAEAEKNVELIQKKIDYLDDRKQMYSIRDNAYKDMQKQIDGYKKLLKTLESQPQSKSEQTPKAENAKALKKVRTTQDLAEQQKLREAQTVETLLPQMKSQVTEHGVEISLADAEIIRRINDTLTDGDMEKSSSIDGLFFPPELIADTIEGIDAIIENGQEAGYDETDLQGLIDLKKNIQLASAKNGTTKLYAFDDAIKHETGHEVDYLEAIPEAKDLIKRVGDLDGKGNVDSFLATKNADGEQILPAIVETASKYFFNRHGYTTNTLAERAVLVQEVWNYIQTGDAEKIGLSPEQEATFKYFYMKAYIARNGEQVLDSFAKFYQQFELDSSHLETIRNEIKEKTQSLSDIQGTQTGDAVTRKGSDSTLDETSGTAPKTESETDRRLPARSAEVEKRQQVANTPINFEPSGKLKPSQTPETLRRNNIEAKDRVYVSTSNVARQTFADAILDEGVESAQKWLDNAIKDKENQSGATAAVAFNLMNHYGKLGDLKNLNKVADDIIPMITDAAQMVQSVSLVNMYNPEQAGTYATKLKKQKTGSDITEKELAKAQELANQLQSTTNNLVTSQLQNDTLTKENETLAQQVKDNEKAITAINKRLLDTKLKLSDVKSLYKKVQNQLEKLIENRPPKQKVGVSYAKLVKELEANKSDILERLQKKFGSNVALKKVTDKLLAPNGKPSNLNPHLYDLVRTPEFKNWFGDWENDAKNASKVVDENGEPLVVYHGTNRDFDTFKKDAGRANDEGFYGKGFYFTFGNGEGSRNEASYYGGKILDVFLKADNPFNFASLTEYKGVHIGGVDSGSIAFLNNLAEKFPDLADKIKVDKTTWNGDEGEVTKVPISVLPKLIEKYKKQLKTFTFEDNRGQEITSGYVVSKTVEFEGSDGTKHSYQDREELGRYSSDAKSEQIEFGLIADAIEKYEGIASKYYPEGYMTRHPEITDAIKAQGYDAIKQTQNGDEIVVFEPTQIKSIFNEGTFDKNNPSILKMVAFEPDVKIGQDEVDFATLKLVDALRNGTTPADFINELNTAFNGKLSPFQLQQLHAEAVNRLQSSGQPLSEEQRALSKNRNQHRKLAKEFTDAEQIKADEIKKNFVNDYLKSLKDIKAKNPHLNLISKIVELAQGKDFEAESVAVAVSKQEGNDVKTILNKLQDEFDLSEKDARKVLMQGNALIHQAKQAIEIESKTKKFKIALNEKDLQNFKTEQKMLNRQKRQVDFEMRRFYEALSKSTLELAGDTITGVKRANLLSLPLAIFGKGVAKDIVSTGLFNVTDNLTDAMMIVGDALLSKKGERVIATRLNLNAFKSVFMADETMQNLDKKSGLATAWGILRHGEDIDEAIKKDYIPTDTKALGERLFKDGTKRQKVAESAGSVVDWYIDKIFRTRGMYDAISKVYAFRKSLEQQASVIAKNEGLSNEERKNLILNPTNVIQIEAMYYAEEMSFQDDNLVNDYWRQLQAKSKAGKFVTNQFIPFAKTVSNVLYRTLQHTPLGLADAARIALKNNDKAKEKIESNYREAVTMDATKRTDWEQMNKAEQLDYIDKELDKILNRQQRLNIGRALSRGALGTAGLSLGYFLAMAGLMAGALDFDDDKEESARRRRAGIENNSVKLGKYRFTTPETPFGTAMAIGATIADNQKLNTKNRYSTVNPFIDAVGESFYEQAKSLPQIRGTLDFLDNQTFPSRAGTFFAPYLTPSWLSEWANISDTKDRTGKSFYPSFGVDKFERKRSKLGEFGKPFAQRLPGLRQKNAEIKNQVNEAERGGFWRKLVRANDPLNVRSAK